MKTSRPSLRIRVLQVLKLGPSTVPVLSETLDANPSRVAEALHRARSRGEVRRRRWIGRGKEQRRWLGWYGSRPQVWELTTTPDEPS